MHSYATEGFVCESWYNEYINRSVLLVEGRINAVTGLLYVMTRHGIKHTAVALNIPKQEVEWIQFDRATGHAKHFD